MSESGVQPARGDELVLEQGTVIAKKYLLERPAGFGGMAELWVATNQATGAEVCVKVLVRNRERGNDDESVERFRREAHAAARLSHRAIIRAFDLLELDDKGEAARGGPPHAYAIVMELLKGETLGDFLAKRGKIPLDEALDLFLPVVSALAHAHRASIIHRDIKPDNIFLAVDPDAQIIPKVLDFGVSKLSNAEGITIDGVVVGTPSFMSPEQAKGARHIDARSDVFSAGLLFYMMLSGANPFEDGAFASVVDAIVRREVPPLPDLAPQIWSVLHKALEKDPALRFADATEMGIELRKAAGRKANTESNAIPLAPLSSPTSLVIEAPPPVPPTAADSLDASRRTKRAMVAAVMGASTAVLFAAVVVALWPKTPPSTSSVRAEVSATAGEASASASTAAPALTEAPQAPAPEPTPEGRPQPTVAATPRPPVKPAAAAAQPAAPPKQRTGPPPSRKPGEEPHMARDPGF